jgi:hypothetical protein
MRPSRSYGLVNVVTGASGKPMTYQNMTQQEFRSAAGRGRCSMVAASSRGSPTGASDQLAGEV